MNAADRLATMRFFVRRAFRETTDTANVHTGEIADAVAAVDDWFDAAPALGGATNQAQIVAAMPAPFGAGTTGAQKALLLAAVALGRSGAF